MKKLAIGFLTLTVLLIGCDAESYPASAQETPNEVSVASVDFSDTAGHWAKAGIDSAVKAGYVDGYQDGTFKPDYNVTRAEFVKMLLTATKQTISAAKPNSAWFTPYTDFATTSGIYHTNDFPADKFNDQLTRVEMAKLAVRYLDKTTRPQAANLYDTSAMYKAVSLGVIQGLVGGELGSDQFTTRAQSVTIIERILTASIGKTLPVDKLAFGNADLALTGSNTRVYMKTPSVPLPVKYSYSSSIDVMVSEIRVSDMDDKDDPVAKRIIAVDPNNEKRNAKLKGKLIVGLNVVIDNKSVGQEPSLDLYSSVLSMIGLGAIGDGSSIYWMDTTKVGKTEGWILYTVDKALNAKGLDGTLPFPLFLTVNGKEIYLTDVTKK